MAELKRLEYKLDANVRAKIADFVKDEPQFDDMTTLIYRSRSKTVF